MAGQADFNQAMRRKVRAPASMALSHGADRVWPMALARAAPDCLMLGLEVTALTVSRLSLAELLEVAPERALIGVMEGPKEGLGVIALSPGLLAGLVEVQTMGRVSPAPVLPRRPTRTDAAMVTGWIDAAMVGLEAGLASDSDLAWADGFRYASFLDDARPLGLLLEDCTYRMMTVEVSLANGAKTGTLHLALPAESRGRKPQGATDAVTEAEARLRFTRHLTEETLAVECTLHALIARLTIPLAGVLGLAPGMVMPLPSAAIDRIAMEASDGKPLAEGRLGQHRGQRAVRLTALVDLAGRGTTATMVDAPLEQAAPMRAAG